MKITSNVARNNEAMDGINELLKNPTDASITLKSCMVGLLMDISQSLARIADVLERSEKDVESYK